MAYTSAGFLTENRGYHALSLSHIMFTSHSATDDHKVPWSSNISASVLISRNFVDVFLILVILEEAQHTLY
jgi:hypothetical protein